MTPLLLRPHLGFDWWRFELVAPGRSHRFRDRAEADAYLARVERAPRAVPGTVNPELQAMADEAAALLRLRQFDWKKKKNPDPEPPRGYETESEEIPF